MPLARPFVLGPRVRTWVAAIAGAATAFIVIATVGAPTASASVGSDAFLAGVAYHGEFADPSVLRVGDVYYAYATNTAGDALPTMSSTDLQTWRPRAGWPKGRYSTWGGFNDAMPVGAAPWAARHRQNQRMIPSVWAPSVAHIGHRYVEAYSAAVTAQAGVGGRYCIGIATSASPQGPFVDHSRRPIVCSSDPRGSIDPQLFQPGDGRVYLIWKNTGVPGHKPTELMAQRMGPAGLALYRGSRPWLLLATARPWEGTVIEQPAMIRYAGRYYLFYSGNGFNTANYAVGYAICTHPFGPCHRATPRPFFASYGPVAGPGGATPFIDTAGRLRMAYAAWTVGHVGYPTSTACHSTPAGCNQRRMHIATLTAGPMGYLHIAAHW